MPELQGEIQPLEEPITKQVVGQLLQAYNYTQLHYLKETGQLSSTDLINYNFITLDDPLGIVSDINVRWLIDTFFSRPQDRTSEVVSFLLLDPEEIYIIQYLVIRGLCSEEIDLGNWVRLLCHHYSLVVDIFIKLGVPLPPNHKLAESFFGRTTIHELILYHSLDRPELFKAVTRLTPGITLENLDQAYLEHCLREYYQESNLDYLLQVGITREQLSGSTLFISALNHGSRLADWWIDQDLGISQDNRCKVERFDCRKISYEFYVRCVSHLMTLPAGRSYLTIDLINWSHELIKNSIKTGLHDIDEWTQMIQSSQDNLARNAEVALRSLTSATKRAI